MKAYKNPNQKLRRTFERKRERRLRARVVSLSISPSLGLSWCGKGEGGFPTGEWRFRGGVFFFFERGRRTADTVVGKPGAVREERKSVSEDEESDLT